MLRFAFSWMVPLFLLWPVGCSDLTDTTSGSNGSADPAPVTRRIKLGCTNNVIAFSWEAGWDLTVDPNRIIGDELFATRLSGVVVIDADLLAESQTLAGVRRGFKRLKLVDLQATVHVRRGVLTNEAGDTDVVLTHEPVPRTCTYDRTGLTGIDAGPEFPQCSADNENPDGSNADCTGLGGKPDPRNGCHEFIDIPTSDDCAPGGECDSLGKAGIGSQCAARGFCITGPMEIPLQEVHTSYEAATAGAVLFGWDDESTGAVSDSSGGPHQGTLILPPAVFEEPPESNGFRIALGGTAEVALECTMGTSVGGARVRPTPDEELIRFTIQAH